MTRALAAAMLGAVGCLVVSTTSGAAAATLQPMPPAAMDMPGMEMNAAEPASSTIAGATRTLVHYEVPDLRLVRDDNRSVRLADELNDGRAVVMNFIYTSCSGVCPLSSQILSELQRKLAGNL